MQEPVLSTATFARTKNYPVAIATVAVPIGQKVVDVKNNLQGRTWLILEDGSEYSCDPYTAEFWTQHLTADKLSWE